MGVLNCTDAEVFINNMSTTTSDLSKLQHPLWSSLPALEINQWLLPDTLPQWEGIEEQTQLIPEALGTSQGEGSLLLSHV